MKKVLVLLVLMMLVLTACGSPASMDSEVKKVETLEEVVTHFESAGFEVGDKEEKLFQMIGATNGFAIGLNGSLIELYKFDPETATDETKKNIENAIDKGVMDMAGFSIPVVYLEKSNILLVKPDMHPEMDKIIETFEELK